MRHLYPLVVKWLITKLHNLIIIYIRLTETELITCSHFLRGSGNSGRRSRIAHVLVAADQHRPAPVLSHGRPPVLAEQGRPALDASSHQGICPVPPVQVLAEAEARRVADAETEFAAVGRGTYASDLSTCKRKKISVRILMHEIFLKEWQTYFTLKID